MGDEATDTGLAFATLTLQTGDIDSSPEMTVAEAQYGALAGVMTTDPSSTNIMGQGSYAITGYNTETFTPLVTMSTDDLLGVFDVRTNSSVAIGSTKNTVYNSLVNNDVKMAITYYPIGNPPIMVSVSTNDADPYGEYWKCEHRNYSGDDTADGGTPTTQKSVVVVSKDGVRYCMPFSKAASQDGNRGLSLRRDFIEKYGEDYRHLNSGHGVDPDSDTWAYYDPLYGEVKDTNLTPVIAVLNTEEMIQRVSQASEVLSLEVVWDSYMIDKLKIDLEEYTLFEDDSLTESAGLFNKYQESALVSVYKARQVARENEFEISYNILEREGLLRRFGKSPSSPLLGTVLNNIYMGMAQFLTSTYIESAYTFKTVKMNQLSNEQITPTNLAVQQSTVVAKRLLDTTTEERATSGYYPSGHVDPFSGESYTDPSLPSGGFVDDRYTGYGGDTSVASVPFSGDTGGATGGGMGGGGGDGGGGDGGSGGSY
jgi:uncharacterized membrane protein YgcG